MIFVKHASRSRSKFFAQIGDQVVVELLHELRLSLDSRARTRITAREDRHGFLRNLPGVLSQHQSMTIRGLAVTSAKRSPAAPDIPTIGETVPGYEVSGWWALFVQAKTPNDIVNKIHSDAMAALGHPSVRERYEAIGAPVTTSTPAELAALLASETRIGVVSIQQICIS